MIELVEYEPRFLTRESLTEAEGEIILRTVTQLDVQFPSPRTADCWVLKSQGWVGRFPITRELHVTVAPKVPIGNLFRMLEYAYSLKELGFPGLADVGTLQDVFERLAMVLARRILSRTRKGLHAAYVPEREVLPYLRGSMDFRERLRRPWVTNLTCDYQEHTSDIEDNQILAWTLWRILRSGVLTDHAAPTVHRAFQAVRGAASVRHVSAARCIRRLYIRLNDDYQPLHALCRFFLEHLGPTHEQGDHRGLPFLLDMARLFELFVAEWLATNLPPGFNVLPQEKVSIGDNDDLSFRIDLVLYRDGEGVPLCVIDTKYKKPLQPSTPDVQEVVAYAESKGCQEAVLVYPAAIPRAGDLRVGQKRVRTLTFELAGDLQAAGLVFATQLLAIAADAPGPATSPPQFNAQ